MHTFWCGVDPTHWSLGTQFTRYFRHNSHLIINRAINYAVNTWDAPIGLVHTHTYIHFKMPVLRVPVACAFACWKCAPSQPQNMRGDEHSGSFVTRWLRYWRMGVWSLLDAGLNVNWPARATAVCIEGPVIESQIPQVIRSKDSCGFGSQCAGVD